MYQGLGTVFWLFFGRKRVDKTPLLELRFKCQIQTKNSESGACYVCLYISKKQLKTRIFTMIMEF